MDTEQKKTLLDSSLERAAAKLGDITVPVIDLYYSRLPDAREAFERLQPGRRSDLEGEMVERTIYTLMQWLECPGEIEIMILGSVPHHDMTLKVPPAWFSGLLDATADVIMATIPAERNDELAVWRELRADLKNLVSFSAGY